MLSALPEGAVIERKTRNDMASCIGANRERFEMELKRGRYVGKLVVVIEGTLADVCAAGRGISHNAIVGTLAAWTLRLLPFCFLWLTARSSRLCVPNSRYPAPRRKTHS